MSWISTINSDVIIRTGDGREHHPKWMNPGREKDYNVTEFEFPGLAGTLLDKQEPKGTKHSIELLFDGDDHLDLAQAFWESADDPRPWRVSHPLYGSLFVQCSSIRQDNTGYNISKFTLSIMETITEDAPRGTEDPVDKITFDKVTLDDTFANSFATNVVEPSPTDVNVMSQNNSSLYAIGKKRVSITDDAEAYFNLFNTATTAINNATADPLAAMRAIQAVINYPALFQQSVASRLGLFQEQINLLRLNLATIKEPSKKRIFQSYGGALISSMATTSATPTDSDYQNRDQVFSAISQVSEAYNTFLQDLDSLQTPNGGDIDSFIPDADSIIALGNLINYTLANLSNIALDSKQERTIYLESDSNPVLLAHRFYGLDQVDANLVYFINSNNIGLNEMLSLRKGRAVKYYV